ncbi:unnamed protein product [Ambrosiozyma monospora]|uniref:Unnamed protein product n=1 Tax=Ambrosiozyma monospora TaxID=43982 RepID=A0ACB5T720_AMBMO|nr:unnamed protein product [Ambrosiozyma monospora]
MFKKLKLTRSSLLAQFWFALMAISKSKQNKTSTVNIPIHDFYFEATKPTLTHYITLKICPIHQQDPSLQLKDHPKLCQTFLSSAFIQFSIKEVSIHQKISKLLKSMV